MTSSGFPDGAIGKESICQCRRYKRHGFEPKVGKIPWRRAWQHTPVFWPEEFHGLYIHGVTKSWTQLSDFHFHRELGACRVVLVVKNPLTSAGDVRSMGSFPGSGRSPGAGHGNPLQDSCLENPMDRGAWRAMVHRVTKSRTHLKQLSMYAHRTRAAFFKL